jgi:hypothetical protein
MITSPTFEASLVPMRERVAAGGLFRAAVHLAE